MKRRNLIRPSILTSVHLYHEYQKLELYKRISSIESKDEMEDMTDELIDRFGEMPKAVYNLLYVAYLKALAHHAYMTDVKQKGEKILFEMKPKTKKVKQLEKIEHCVNSLNSLIIR